MNWPMLAVAFSGFGSRKGSTCRLPYEKARVVARLEDLEGVELTPLWIHISYGNLKSGHFSVLPLTFTYGSWDPVAGEELVLKVPGT